jgi:AhpD family alkylhydroperoxidase
MPRLNYPKLAPDAYRALQALGHYLHTATALEPALLGLVFLRASLVNGCGFCIGMHTAELKHLHEPQSRIDALANWQTSNAFTPRERAALAWTDALTNIQQSHASDADYAAVSEFFKDKDLVDLTFAIAQINAWNRLSIGFAAEWHPAASSVVPPTQPSKPNA